MNELFLYLLLVLTCTDHSAIPRLPCPWRMFPLVRIIELHLLLGRRWLWILLSILNIHSNCGGQKKPMGSQVFQMISHYGGQPAWEAVGLQLFSLCKSWKLVTKGSQEYPVTKNACVVCVWMNDDSFQTPTSFFGPCEFRFQIHCTCVILLCALSGRIWWTVQTWGAHKSKQSISKKSGLLKCNPRKVLESEEGIYNRVEQSKRLRWARTGERHSTQRIIGSLSHLGNFNFRSFCFPFLLFHWKLLRKLARK